MNTYLAIIGGVIIFGLLRKLLKFGIKVCIICTIAYYLITYIVPGFIGG